MRRRVTRLPTAAELELINEAREAAAPIVADLSDTGLHGFLVAALRELSTRDGLPAASAWCAHWGERLMLAAGPAEIMRGD